MNFTKSDDLKLFEREMRNAQLTILALKSIDDLSDDLKKELIDEASKKDSAYSGYTFDILRKDISGALLNAQAALIQEALETYSMALIAQGDKSSSCIIQHAPYYTLRVDPKSQEYHVADIARDIRDRLLHALPRYNILTSGLGPVEILSQSIDMERDMNGNIVEVHFLAPGEKAGSFSLNRSMNRMMSGKPGVVYTGRSSGIMKYVDLLIEEITICATEVDKLRNPTNKTFKKSIMDQNDYVKISYV